MLISFKNELNFSFLLSQKFWSYLVQTKLLTINFNSAGAMLNLYDENANFKSFDIQVLF